ncbi:3D domain-containing protein [Oleidesulfovibrio sp.]|uniref:3D domain-containing protein n=1 Tax=Oleidesulfovibrio sp. TaxID=2909707 RepID=UPI003A875E53
MPLRLMSNFLLFSGMIVCIAVLQIQNSRIAELETHLENLSHNVGALDARIEGEEALSGLALKFAVSNKATMQNLSRMRTVTVTAYSPRESETDSSPYYTASNRPVRAGILAVSRDLFDSGWVFGRKVYIKSLGIFTIDDLMAGSKQNQVDIFMFDTSQALEFGKRTMQAHLLDLPHGTIQLSQTELK